MTDKTLAITSTRRKIGKISIISAVACLACFAGPIIAILTAVGLGTWFGVPIFAMMAIGVVTLAASLVRGRATNSQQERGEPVAEAQSERLPS